MPMYFFDIVQIDGTFSEDIIGIDLLDSAAAKREGKRCLAELTEKGMDLDLSEVRVRVRDAAAIQVALLAAFPGKQTRPRERIRNRQDSLS